MIRRQTITKSFKADEQAERKKEVPPPRILTARRAREHKAETYPLNEKKFVVDFTKHVNKATTRKNDEFLDMFKAALSKDEKESATIERSSQKHKSHIPRTAKKYMIGDLHKKSKDKREAQDQMNEKVPVAKNTELSMKMNSQPYPILSAKRAMDKTHIYPQFDNKHTENNKIHANNYIAADHEQAMATLNELPLSIVGVRRPSHPNAILHHLYNGYFNGFFRKPTSPQQSKKIIGLTYVTHEKNTNKDAKPITNFAAPSPPTERYTTGNHVRHRLLSRRKLQRRASSQKCEHTNIESVSIERISPISFVSKPDSMVTNVHSEPAGVPKLNAALPSISPLLEMQNH